ncbi:MAG: SDR family oxidoreductase [Armatimonas sp.]
MSIAVTGATGQLGRLVVEALKARVPASEIVAMVRTPEKAVDLGVAVRPGDYTQPETLEQSLAGVDTLLLISSNEIGQRAAQHANVITAAKKAGVKRIVYTSLLRADTSTISLAAEHLATEETLKASGVPFTILRNGWYTENHTGSISGALAGGAFLGSASDAKFSSAARADFAEAAAVALTTEGHEGNIYELAGDTPYTLSDFAAELSRQTGKEIPYKDLPQAEYGKILAGFGIPQDFANAIAGWDVSAAQGDLLDSTHQLSTLIGRPTTPFAETIAEALK